MSKPETPSPYSLETAKLQWRETHIPAAEGYEDIYFSKQHGLNESRYVFLQNNHLQQRWQDLADGQLFTIGETGFGTGLNFLSAWQLWRQQAPKKARLHFVSVEKHPLVLSDIRHALAGWPELKSLSEQLLAQYPVLTPGLHVLDFDEGRVQLKLWLGEAIDGFEQLRCSHHCLWQDRSQHRIDAWFLDGFAPAKNPDLWTDTLYGLLADLSQTGTTVATFTAVGAVRRGLIEHGFSMEKVAGFGNKREMLRGRFDASLDRQPTPPITTKKAVKAPWMINRPSRRPSAGSKRVTVIGGGLAGTTSAYAMAQRGWQVTLVERAEQLATGASGNPQGMLYTKLSPQVSTLNQFTLSSYLYALRYFRQWQVKYSVNQQQLDFCGVLQLATTAKEQQLMAQIAKAFTSHPDLVKVVGASQASSLAGIKLTQPGCWYPGAGWLSPVHLCQSLVQHPNISTLLEQEVIDIVHDNGQWQLLNRQQQTLASSEVVIIANSRDAAHFTQTRQLPLKTIRGQISQLEATDASTALRTVICYEGYLTPAINGRHSLGATFDIGDSDIRLRVADHQRNIDSLNQALPELFNDTGADLFDSTISGRASLRCSTPDYLPMVGPVHQHQDFINDYAALGKNALQDIATAGRYYPQLYINVGHGSRGLTSTPLCSELLAALIDNEVPPLPRSLLNGLNPARFVIRDLIRNRT